jgi:monomeric sarcosine oxidase
LVSERYDAIVVGGGLMGTATARHLAKRGRHVLLFERFGFGHANGSSGGPTRIFRLAYHHPTYVRMARQALEEWRALEDEAGESLLVVTGGLDVGTGGRTTAEALRAAGESFEYVTPAAVAERWPSIRYPTDEEVFFQAEGGVCRAAQTVTAQARVAKQLGAEVRDNTVVERITPKGDDVEVLTDAGDVCVASVAVVTTGPWAGPLLRTAGLALPLVPSFEQVTYFRFGAPVELPTVIDWNPSPVYTPYTVPDPWAPAEFKTALHLSGPPADADARSFEPDPERVDAVETYVAEHFAGATPTGATDTCLYTNTPDEDFLLDRIGPLVLGSPCSGHGAKFTPFMGRILADLATGEEPPLDLTMFGHRRPAIVGAGT